MLPAGLKISAGMCKFAAEIPNFPEQPDEDGFLHFPVPVPFLEGRTDMFVRDVHKALRDHVAMEQLEWLSVYRQRRHRQDIMVAGVGSHQVRAAPGAEGCIQ